MQKRKLFFISFVLISLFGGAHFAYAQVGALKNITYEPLVELPLQPDKFFTSGVSSETGLIKYLTNIFKIGIGIAGLLAVIMIMYGGIIYMSTDSFTGKSEGKEIIKNALLGLMLALISWLILNTINPDILSFKQLDLPLNEPSAANTSGANTRPLSLTTPITFDPSAPQLPVPTDNLGVTNRPQSSNPQVQP